MTDEKPKILTVERLRAEAADHASAVRLGDRFSEWVTCPHCRGSGRARGTIISFGPFRGLRPMAVCGHCNNGYVKDDLAP